MKHRKLRIAWSVVWAMLAALLCVLWRRSYWTLDFLSRVNDRKIQTTIGSQSGTVYFAHFNAEIGYKGTGNPYTSHGWQLVSRETHEVPKQMFVWKRHPSSHHAAPRAIRNALNIVVPHWFLAIIAVPIGAISWLPYRFSLRTLLIGMTLVAAVLGLPAYAANK